MYEQFMLSHITHTFSLVKSLEILKCLQIREGLGDHMHPKSWHCQNWVMRRILPYVFITNLSASPIETPSNGGRDFHPYRGGKNPYRGGEPWFRWRRHFSWQIETLSLTPARLRRLLRLWRLLKLNILSAKWWQCLEMVQRRADVSLMEFKLNEDGVVAEWSSTICRVGWRSLSGAGLAHCR